MSPTKSQPIALLLIAVLMNGCTDETPAPVRSVSIMAFNVENLFDNEDDPGKDDRTYFRIEDKQTEEHRAACSPIAVDRWREQCLDWDWSDEIIAKKLEVVAATIFASFDATFRAVKTSGFFDHKDSVLHLSWLRKQANSPSYLTGLCRFNWRSFTADVD